MELEGFLKIYIIALSFIIGLIMGSFTNCAAYRIARGEDFVHGRSRCASCGRSLSWIELIPLVSYMIQGGKSRCCKEELSLRYPLTELFTGILFALIALRWGISFTTVMLMLLGMLLLAIALVDSETGLIPDGFIIAGIVNFLLFSLLEGEAVSRITRGLISGLAIALPILIISLLMDKILNKETMGGGDIKLFFMTGLYFNIKINILLVLLSCIFGIIFTLVFKNIKIDDEDNSMAFPFGPSIGAATVVCILAGESIIDMYMKLF